MDSFKVKLQSEWWKKRWNENHLSKLVFGCVSCFVCWSAIKCHEGEHFITIKATNEMKTKKETEYNKRKKKTECGFPGQIKFKKTIKFENEFTKSIQFGWRRKNNRKKICNGNIEMCIV